MKIFNTTGLKFKPPQIDTCHKCDEFKNFLKYDSNEKTKQNIRASQKNHQDKTKLAYDSKAINKNASINNKNKIKMVCGFDLQQCLS